MGGNGVATITITPEQARLEVAERLAARRDEIEQAIATRIYAISDPCETTNPDYLEGLHAALTAALDYALVAVERGEERSPPIPAALLSQARMAARSGVRLDTVLRRYFAGYSLLGEFLMAEAERGGLMEDAGLRRLLRGQAALFDRLLATVSEEHTNEAARRIFTSEQRRTDRLQRLLAGEAIDVGDLNYELDAYHLGIIAHGFGAAEAIRELVAPLDRRLLLVRRDDDTVWAWLGGRRAVDVEELTDRASDVWPPHISLVTGEPGWGLSGWRLSHRQARAALTIALRSPQRVVRYADVALLASMLRDDLLAASLHKLYLVPLERKRADAEELRRTLAAYFAADRNVSSAAAALGVNRNTVASRLRAVEEAIGRPVAACATGIDAALRLEQLSGRPPRQAAC